MSNSIFRSLTQGASFEKRLHGREMKLFSQGKKRTSDITQIIAGDEVTPVLEAPIVSSKAVWSSIPAPAPPSLFETRKTSGNVDKGEEDAAPEENSEDKPLKAMSRKRMLNIWSKHHITVKTSSSDLVPPPIRHFSDLVRPPLSAPRTLVTNLFSRNHRIPTPVQMQVIPTLINGRDVVACAPTGSGKTVAYVAPLFARLKSPNRTAGVRALIVAPSMELAVQIEREVFLLMKGMRWRLVQHGQGTKGKDIMVTTPQRLLTMIEKKLIDVSNVEYLVFDEGDKLWDGSTSFLQMVDTILAACTNPNRVTALFTATLSKHVEEMALSAMRNDPVRVIIEGRTASSRDVEQRLCFTTHERGKVMAMRDLLDNGVAPPVLIFVQSVERTNDLYDEINRKGLHCAVMHGKMSVEERESVVLNFRLGKIWFLITTDLLARGIDFKGVRTVINYDFPQSTAAYVHRVGRTGRAGSKGLAITFFTEDDRERLPLIAGIIKESGSEIPDWMLEIKTSRSRRKQLEHETPHRNIISTRKQRFLREKAIERELKQIKKEKEKKRGSKRTRGDARQVDGGEDDECEEYEEVSDGELQA